MKKRKSKIENGMKIGVIYARYSSHSQTEQSIEGQLHDAYEYAKRNDIHIIHEYIDRAFSGTSDNRPEFQRMMRDAEKGEFNIALVWKMDRFSRQRRDFAVYKALLQHNGVRVVSVMENLPEGSQSILLESILEGMAEYYSKNLSENIRRGQQESIRKGWYPGGTIPYGYVKVDHQLIADPATVPIVKEIFTRYADGERTSVIVKDLNDRCILFKQGRHFQNTTIGRIVGDPSYIGEFTFAGQVVVGCSEQIIDRDLFERANVRREQNRRAPAAGRTGMKNYLLGKLFCGECGMNMAGDGGVGKLGKYYYYYTCRKKKKDRNSCDSKTIKKDDIEYAVCKVISDFLLNKSSETLETLADYISDTYNTDGFEENEIHEFEVQLRKINNDIEKLIDSLTSMPTQARERVGKRIEDMETQRVDLEMRLAKKRLEHDDIFSRDSFLEFLKYIMLDLDNELNREFIINKFLNCAYVYKDGKLVIYLNNFSNLPNGSDRKPKPGKDDHKNGSTLITGKIPNEIKDIPDFQRGSTLISYAPLDANKLEPHTPHLFFLHGRVGIVVWFKDVRK